LIGARKLIGADRLSIGRFAHPRAEFAMEGHR
jgi:hypothetical protein